MMVLVKFALESFKICIIFGYLRMKMEVRKKLNYANISESKFRTLVNSMLYFPTGIDIIYTEICFRLLSELYLTSMSGNLID